MHNNALLSILKFSYFSGWNPDLDKIQKGGSQIWLNAREYHILYAKLQNYPLSPQPLPLPSMMIYFKNDSFLIRKKYWYKTIPCI